MSTGDSAGSAKWEFVCSVCFGSEWACSQEQVTMRDAQPRLLNSLQAAQFNVETLAPCSNIFDMFSTNGYIRQKQFQEFSIILFDMSSASGYVGKTIFRSLVPDFLAHAPLRIPCIPLAHPLAISCNKVSARNMLSKLLFCEVLFYFCRPSQALAITP